MSQIVEPDFSETHPLRSSLAAHDVHRRHKALEAWPMLGADERDGNLTQDAV
jgi:hypothetical protein